MASRGRVKFLIAYKEFTQINNYYMHTHLGALKKHIMGSVDADGLQPGPNICLIQLKTSPSHLAVLSGSVKPINGGKNHFCLPQL